MPRVTFATVKQKWFAYTTFLLGIGMAVQVASAYVVQWWGATVSARNAFAASTKDGFEADERRTVGELDAAVARIAASAVVEEETGAALEHAIVDQLGARRDLHAFWAILDRDGKVGRTSDAGCTRVVERGHLGRVLACDGGAVLATSHALSGHRWASLVLGWRLDDRYAAHFSELANAEILVFVDGTRRASSLRDREGAPLSLEVAPSALAEAANSDALVFRSDGRSPATYRGYAPEGNRFAEVSPTESWYYGARRLASESGVVLVIAVPVSWMTIGDLYCTAAIAAISVVLLVVMGILVRRLVTRFTKPLDALTLSAKGVAAGDLTQTVPEPDDAEMRDFCQVYNQMLASMSELMALRQKNARDAGMAEIANGVLHNIGNVLNSVNVSMTLARESARGSRIAGVTKLAKLVDRHRATIGDFLTKDPRGQKVPDYLRSVAAELERERETLAAELASATQSIDHIKRIVGAQQRYAGPGGIRERCAIEEIVNDAIRMSASSLSSRGIVLEPDLEPAALDVDRHKLLQIVVNLITNAKQAVLDNAAGASKRIVIRSRVVDGRVIRVDVTDSGHGIAPENRARIFAQGFTTKAHGHGIGLHNSAIAAQQMGGSLSFDSEGLGHGATFTLEIPVASHVEAHAA